MKKFTKVNEGFVCGVCGHKNPPAEQTCRNHCRKCLHSLHVDKNPGDRAESCHGFLIPTGVEISRGMIQNILFICKKCRKQGKNLVAKDDNREALLRLAENQ